MIADLAEKRKFIVFAGAGVPMESGPPITWKGLLATFKEKEPELATRNIDEVDEDEYPDYAQEIFEALRGKGRESRYYEILREKLRATNARCSSEQRDIIETARHVITTNFDDSFERGVERVLEGNEVNTFTIQDLPDFRINVLSDDYSVSYLHGRTSEKCIVFKKDDYETFYPSQSENGRGNDNLELFLRYLYEEWTIVFIGVSFNDKYLLNALNRFYNRVKQNDEVGREMKVSYKSKLNSIQHYAFMPEDMGIKVGERCRDKDNTINEQKIEFSKFVNSYMITDSSLRDELINAYYEKYETCCDKIQIWPSNKIPYAYYQKNYSRNCGPLGSSCMRYKEFQKAMQFYVKNNVKIAVVG